MKRALALLLLSTLAVAGPPMSQSDAEKSARSRWFEFELRAVPGGDWVAFTKAKEAKEKALLEEGRTHVSPRSGPVDDVGLRGRRLVQEEFEAVAKPREEEIQTLARKVLAALAKGDLETVAADCTMYDATATDRLELTRKYLQENKAALQKAAQLASTDGGVVVRGLSFESPAPERGMTGRVTLSFGPKAKVPPGTPSDRYPDVHQIELWWSGEVMPEANGPLHAAPTTPRPKSRWRFNQVVLPFSQRPVFLQ